MKNKDLMVTTTNTTSASSAPTDVKVALALKTFTALKSKDSTVTTTNTTSASSVPTDVKVTLALKSKDLMVTTTSTTSASSVLTERRTLTNQKRPDALNLKSNTVSSLTVDKTLTLLEDLWHQRAPGSAFLFKVEKNNLAPTTVMTLPSLVPRDLVHDDLACFFALLGAQLFR
eukprot:GHVU01214120.1.p2 GENE.GHVU01214120.1~~GHVU01214120.1.p2  ORF type:complete len:173 (+),score=28.63 GHVU01214120.1:327-845(+)